MRDRVIDRVAAGHGARDRVIDRVAVGYGTREQVIASRGVGHIHANERSLAGGRIMVDATGR